MKLIPTRVHGVLDYIVGILLILAPRLLGFDHTGIASSLPVTLGVTTIVYSLLTRYELGFIKVLPFRLHLGMDALAGLLLAVSPWLFGFADHVWVPHLAVGLLEIVIVMLSRREVATLPPGENLRTPRSRAA